MACSQFIPAIQIGAPITYWGPLVSFFVMDLLFLFIEDKTENLFLLPVFYQFSWHLLLE